MSTLQSARTSQAGRLHLTRRGRAVIVAGLFALLVVLGSIAGHATTAAAGVRTPVQHVTVRSGETLWQLASRIDPTGDPRVVVAQLEAVNHLSSDEVAAGQRLAVSGLAAG